MRAMKDSGIECVGDIPVDWSMRRLRFLCFITTGNQDTQDNDPDGEYPFYVRSPIVERSHKYTFDGPAILMSGDGAGAGRIFHKVSGKYACHQRVYSMQNIHDIDSAFLFYYLRELFPVTLEMANAKSTVDSVRLPMLQDFTVLLPSPAEQQRIAAYLDEQCGEIDKVLAKTRESIEEYKKLKQSVITEAVTKGIRPDRPMKPSGIEWIGDIPAEWEKSTVLQCIQFEGGSQPPLSQFVSEPLDGYVRLIQNRDYKTDAYAVYVPLSSVSKFCNENDVMIGRYGPPLFVIHRGLAGAYNVAIMKAIPKLLHREFMFYYLQNYTLLEYINSFSVRAAGQSGVNPSILKKYVIFIPPMSEQEEIAAYLYQQCTEIDRLIAKKEQIITELEGYKKSLIYECVTGKREVAG